MIKKIVYTVIGIFLFTFSIHSQQEYNEDLTQLDFKELYKQFEKHLLNSESPQAEKYARAFFLKAKKIKDKNRVAEGYYYRIISNPQELSQKTHLYDSIISLKDELKNSNFLTIAYLDKGYKYSYELSYDRALENYIEAKNYNNGSNKDVLAFKINLSIAELKIRIEENKEALAILKKSWENIITYNYKDLYTYNSTLLNLANVHRKLENIDSSNIYTRLGIKENNNANKEQNYYYYFLLLQEINELKKNNNAHITPNMNRVIEYMNRVEAKENLSLVYHHIGEAYLRQGKQRKAIPYFLKVDSIVNNSTSILPEALGSYAHIVDYYESNGDLEKEHVYLKKFTYFDSILNTNYKSINNKIKDKYDFPIRIKKYEDYIKTLEINNKRASTIINIFYSIIVIGFLIVLYLYAQKNKYKKRFKQLQENKFLEKKETKNISEKVKPVIPEEIFFKVENCLIQFEAEKQFLDSTINSEKLAQQIGTNRSYFAKAFNYLKNENFNVYLRNIRLDYALERLRNDKMFRKYTIKTIALESGFNNPESFSKYFYKKYKIYPSYFIKKINNVES